MHGALRAGLAVLLRKVPAASEVPVARLTAAPADTAQEAQADLEAAALEGSEVGLMLVGSAARVTLEARPDQAALGALAAHGIKMRILPGLKGVG